MKQPKFRGYSRETKSWRYGHGWFEIDYTDEFLKEKGIEQQAMLYTEGYPVECDLSSMSQFTGLRDERNNEIYENDIMQDNYLVKGKVFYYDGSFRLSSEMYDLSLSDCETFDDLNHYLITDNGLVVVGNLYENPNLVTVLRPFK